MRSALFALICVLSLVTFDSRCPAAQTKAVSGRAVGEMTPSFPVLAVTGPHKGKSICYVCEYKDAPTIFAFFRQTGDGMGGVVKKLNELAHQNDKIRVVAIVIEGPDSQPELERFAQENSITIPLTVFRKGKDDVAMKLYKLNANMDNTILVSVKRKVAANLVNVKAENFTMLTNTITKVLDKK